VEEAKILLVEDEPDIRELVRLYLLNHNYQVMEAEDGTQALELVKKENPDLMILDIVLPDFDGVEVCRQVRENYSFPIIFLSCKMESEDIISGLDTGGDDYITKPFDPGILVSRVKASLRRYYSAEKNRRKPETDADRLIEPLTRREMEILALIEQGLTNQEIALHFHISTGTVKGYNNQIFGKLKAKNRTQAILRARELHLF
jgi:DNA-binding NarL/FixJ family response regulator